MREIVLKGLDESVWYEKILDKMPTYVLKNDKVKGTFMALGVKYGSIHQEFKNNNEVKYHKVPSGIAHFIEHLKFYEPDGTTATDFFNQYGSDVNAFTTFEYTCYHVYTTQAIKENLEHLLEFVLTPCFNKKNVNKERNIILEELGMQKDSPESQIFYKNYENVFHKYKYKEIITGEKEDIKKITLEDIELIFDTFYHPENMFLIVTGNVNPYDIFKVTENQLKKKKIPNYRHPKMKKIKEPVNVVKEKCEITGNVENTKVKITIKTPISNFKMVDPIELRVIMSLILNSNFGSTSDLKEELMEKELIHYLSFNRHFCGEYVLLTVSMETSYPEYAIKEVKNQFKKLKMTEENFKRKINSSIATLVLNYDDIQNVNEMMQEEIISYGEIVDDLKEHIESITFDKVLQVMEKIDLKNMEVTILKPKE